MDELDEDVTTYSVGDEVVYQHPNRFGTSVGIINNTFNSMTMFEIDGKLIDTNEILHKVVYNRRKLKITN